MSAVKNRKKLFLSVAVSVVVLAVVFVGFVAVAGLVGKTGQSGMAGEEVAAVTNGSGDGNLEEASDHSGGGNPGGESGAEAEEAKIVARHGNLEAVKEYLSTYPNDYEELQSKKGYQVVHGKQQSGREDWDAFYQSVQNGRPAEITIIQYSTEGDAILDYINYNGDMRSLPFYWVRDSSRDAWGGGGDGYWEEWYPYLKCFTGTAKNGDRYLDIYLTKQESITQEEIEQRLGMSMPESVWEQLGFSGIVYAVYGNEHAQLDGNEAWHDVKTKFDESKVLIAADKIDKFVVTTGADGEQKEWSRSASDSGFQELLERYAQLDFAQEKEEEQEEKFRSGYAYAIQIYGSGADEGFMQIIMPYKDGVQIDGTFYDGSMNGTSVQLLQIVDSLWRGEG